MDGPDQPDRQFTATTLQDPESDGITFSFEPKERDA
jgi:hypothetical protein